MDWQPIVQAILFALFYALSSALYLLLLPTYNNLLVPELQTSSLYPPLSASAGPSSSYLSEATDFSGYVVLHLVDPVLALVVLGVGIVYLLRSVWPTAADRSLGLLARLIVAAVLANFTLPLAGALLGIAGAVYPVVSGYDGGAWQDWNQLAGNGLFQYSWDNGALQFVISVVLFSLVFGLALAVALRNALLGVLLVLLPIFTILWPIRELAPLARRAWWLFGALCFWPCLLVIPLELAVGSPSVLLLMGYLTVALASPALLGVAGSQLSSMGFPAAGGFVLSGLRQGLGSASQGVARVVGPVAQLGSGRLGSTLGAASRTAGSAAVPVTFPMLAADFLGRGTAHLVRHVPAVTQRLLRPSGSFPGVERGPGAPK